MPRWNGGVIGAANNPTSSSAKGIWSLSEATKAIRAGLWPPSNAGADPYFENVTLLLPGDGTNGAQNNTFLDSSTNNFTITRNGNTTQGTFTPFSKADGRWGNYFDGSGDYLSAASNTALDCGTGNFTIEAWVYITSRTLNYPAIFSNNNGTYSAGALALTNSNSDNASYNDKFVLACYDDTVGAPALVASSTNDKSTWYHVALVRNGTTITMYRNGVSVASKTISASLTFNWGKSGFLVGGGNWDGAQSYFNGYISNARLVKGTAVYTSAFTPSTAPLTAITNTSLLTCQSNRFIDNSTNAFAITRNGDVAVSTFSPFPTLTAYAAGTNGGSGYFDGSGDCLTLPSSSNLGFGTSNFCVEFWFNAGGVTQPATPRIIGNNLTFGTNAWTIGISSNNLFVQIYNFTTTNPTISTSTNVINPQWNHIVLCRSGSDFGLFVNGTRVGTYSTSATLDGGGSQSFCVGGRTTSEVIGGYISDCRVVIGSSVYTPTSTTLTVPTAPLTAITNTQLLCNFTNGGIIDTSMSNDLETVGNAQISTTQSKFGGASMSFDGTGDYLIMRDTQNLVLGTGDFTIEFWVYYNSGLTSDVALFDGRPASTNGVYPLIYSNTTGKVVWYISSAARITATTTLSTGTWYHIAVARSGTSTKMFINGTQEGSTYTDSNSYLLGANRPTIGAAGATLGADPLNGYIDDLRITKGYARYTANFTAPTGPFNGFGD